jgi:hypothetical protein
MNLFILSIVVFLSECICSAEWSGWQQDANAVFSIARMGSRLYCGMRNGEIRSWRLGGRFESAPESDRVPASEEFEAEDGISGGKK